MVKVVFFLLESMGSGCPILQSQGLMYKAFKGVPFTPSNNQFYLWIFKAKATQNKEEW